MRRVLLIIIPALLLAGLIALNNTIPNWLRPVVTGSPGDVLYVATFDGTAGDEFNRDWELSAGRLATAITDGIMRVSVDDQTANAGVYTVSSAMYADFDLTVQATAISGPEDNSYGIVFRLQDHENSNFNDDDSYVFLISSDGYYRVRKVIGGEETILSDWIDSPLINIGIGEANAIRVIAEGDTFRFFINGTQVELCVPDDPSTGVSTYYGDECIGGSMISTLQDDSIASGRIGVGAITTTETAAGEVLTVDFDNLVILAPSQQSEAT